MEDHNQSRHQPDADKEEKILDLTKEMELADQAKHKIFDLTDGAVIQESSLPEKEPLSPPPQIPEGEKKEDTSSNADESAKDPLTDAASDTSSPPAESPESAEIYQNSYSPLSDADATTTDSPSLEATDLQAEIGSQPEGTASASDENSDGYETPGSIEDEVDAAFDAVQFEQPHEEPEAKSDQLFDKLSGITQMVDDAVRQLNADDPSQQPQIPPVDDATLAFDAAELDAAISGDDEDDDIIDLTDVVDPAEIKAGETAEATDDDIIDLVEIVDPVDMDLEFPESDGMVLEDETADLSGSTSQLSPPAGQDTESLVTPDQGEEDLILSDLDDLDLNVKSEPDVDLADDFDTAEMDELIREADLIIAQEEISEVSEQAEGQAGDDGEEIILLTDVLKRESGEGSMPAAESKQPEEIAEEPASDEGTAADTSGPAPSPQDDKEHDVLSNNTIEAAVEHLLKTKYADTIQRMIAEAVEKAVTREIENIRQGLSDEDTP